jgi:4-diphosphocytidyl-2-C-methyl-D-erythritol kinase
LTISRAAADGIAFKCNDQTLPTNDDNLVVRAAKLFMPAAAVTAGLNIRLQKNIPHGAGLGGGSSDAAAVLVGLNRMFGEPLAQQHLFKLAAEIGSDVPFFVAGSAAVCRGRGERVETVQLGASLPLLLLKPAFGVPTPWAYSRWRDAVPLPGIKYDAQEFEGLQFVNDLERPVFEKHQFLAHAKMWLLGQPEVGAALMSGSGSTMFAVLREAGSAELLASRARAELDPDLWTCACETAGR